MGTLDGSIALVTGAASGIGAATARALFTAGATIALVDRHESGARQVADDIGGGHVVAADLAVPADAVGCVGTVLDALGRIDILVNAAGIGGDQASILDASPEDWAAVLAINLHAPFVMMQTVGRHMVERGGGGRIVNVTSSSAFRALATGAAYAAAKAALGQLTRTAAANLAPYDINVNAVAPGLTETGMTATLEPDTIAALVSEGPLANLFGRASTPDDVAAAIRFLCEPASRQITAQTIHVSAGAVV